MNLAFALNLAEHGFYLFPLRQNSKLPAVKNWSEVATRDHDTLQSWFTSEELNLGIYTGRFMEEDALIVVDIDNKKGKSGDAVILKLELEGFIFPPTLEQSTPSGGRHLVYRSSRALKQGVNVLGEAVDIRSRGGYIVAPKSSIDGNKYTLISDELVYAPAWLIDRLSTLEERTVTREPTVSVDYDYAAERALSYIQTVPGAVKGDSGQGRDMTTFKLAAKLKDFGCTEDQALYLLAAHWNNTCVPPWEDHELAVKVNKAYTYGSNSIGCDSPEAVFSVVENLDPSTLSPIERMNATCAFVKNGGFVIEETENERGHPILLRHTLPVFHAWYANNLVEQGNRKVPISKLWLESPARRSYQSLVFAPGGAPEQFYNLWGGFAVDPADTLDMNNLGLKLWLDHLHRNVCGSDVDLTHWLTCWFAQLIQKPEIKPLVALVFKGKKGSGKNALVERVGALLGKHFTVATSERYLVGNFNAHLEDCLLEVFDEACWAGDKRAEGQLKGLITGTEHVVEQKNKEATKHINLTRVVILGNEDWLVPATSDERRYAVFNVGDGNRLDRKFFSSMRESLEAGGYAHLLRFLMDYRITADINDAPNTEGLLDQKLASLELMDSWWHDCLQEGYIYGQDQEEWPSELSSGQLQYSFKRYIDSRNVRARLPSATKLGAYLSTRGVQKIRKRSGKDRLYFYDLGSLADARKEFELQLGGAIAWQEEL